MTDAKSTTETTEITESVVDAAAAAESETTSADGSHVPYRRDELFIRGLNFSTRELALARHIETVAPVQDVHILVGFKNRSKGTAFVSLKNPNLVDEVVEKLNGKPLDGRFLEIQRAKPLSELPPKPRIIYLPTKPRFQRYQPFYNNRRQQFRPHQSEQYRPRQTEQYRPREQYHQRGAAAAAAPAAAAQDFVPAPATTVTVEDTHKTRFQKGEPNPNRKLSEYTVAVLNLPFVAKENDMADIFEGYTILNPRICRTRRGLSKGTAFVTFPTHEEQVRAMENVTGSHVEGRQIRIVEAYLLPEEIEEEKRIIKEQKKHA